MTGTLGKLHHLAICVSDLERARAFYTPVLGRFGYQAPVLMEDRFYFYAGPGGGIGIWPARQNAPNVPHDMYSPGLHHLCFAADSRADVDSFHAHLQDHGIEVLDAPAEYDYMPGYYSLFFLDPDGIKLELCHTPDFPPA